MAMRSASAGSPSASSTTSPPSTQSSPYRAAQAPGTMDALPQPKETRMKLDGRTFEGIVLECGKRSGDAETITFKNGRFHSTACHQYGYGDAPHKTLPAPD